MTDLRVDHHREQRTGVAEAVYAPGKSPQQCATAVSELLAGPGTGPVLLTRASAEQAAAAIAASPGATSTDTMSTDTMSSDTAGADTSTGLQTLVWRRQPPRPGKALVLTAGTSDLPVAHEAAAVLEAYGVGTRLVADVGVAGLHRILAQQEALAAADVVLVVAGMEGALASVAAGLTRAPVIGVPTSTGYGAGLEGVTALLSMLASCSPGITVVGIDNGFGAACAAVRFLNGRASDEREQDR